MLCTALGGWTHKKATISLPGEEETVLVAQPELVIAYVKISQSPMFRTNVNFVTYSEIC